MLQINDDKLIASIEAIRRNDLPSTSTTIDIFIPNENEVPLYTQDEESEISFYGFDDESLALLLSTNFEKHFPIITLYYQDLLLDVAYKKIGDPFLAHDIVQDAWVKAYKHLKHLPSDRISTFKLRSWLCTVTKNEALDQLDRKNASKKKESKWIEYKKSEPGTIDPLELLILKSDLLLAMKKLSKSQYQVIENHYFLGLTLREIAIKLGVTLGTIKKTHSRAIDKLRQCYLL